MMLGYRDVMITVFFSLERELNRAQNFKYYSPNTLATVVNSEQVYLGWIQPKFSAKCFANYHQSPLPEAYPQFMFYSSPVDPLSPRNSISWQSVGWSME